MSDLFSLLDATQEPYSIHKHQAVFTVEESNRLLTDIEGQKTKNLFLRNKKGDRHLLLVAADTSPVDLKRLGIELGIGRLSFASADRLERLLGVQPGSVSPLALINDKEHNVELVVDRLVWEASFVQCHPLINTQTVVLSLAALRQFLVRTGHEPQILDLVKG